MLTPLAVGVLLVSQVLPRAGQAQQAVAVSASARWAGQVLHDYCDRAKAAAEAVGRSASTTSATAAALAARSLVSRGLADGVRVTGSNGTVAIAVGPVPASPTDCGSTLPDSTGSALSAVLPLTTPDGKFAGTAVASFTLAGQVIARLHGAVRSGDVALTDGEGRIVASAGAVGAADVRRARGPDPGPHGGRFAGWSPPAPGQPYGVVVLQAAAAGPHLVVLGGAVLLVAVLLAVLIASVSARAVTAPFDELAAAAARVAKGDLSTVIPVRRRDEAGRLAESFNAMTAELRDQMGQLQTSRHELEAGMARLGDTLSSTHDLDRILSVVLASAMASTRAHAGMILLVGPGRRDLSLAVSRNLDVPHDLRIAMGDGVSGRVALSGEPIRGWLGDGAAQLTPGPSEPSATSVIAVPMLAGVTVLGVLDLFGSSAPDGFAEEDLATIRTFASQATVAVDNVMLHDEAQRLSVTDALTGQWNYRYFTLAIGKEIERAARFERPLSLLMIDLDLFKAVNDSFGHLRGDVVLVELAARVRSCVRDVDIVARYGGEEFVVVLPETAEQGAAMLADRVCDTVRSRAFGAADEPPVWLTVSVGAAVFPQHGTTAGLLVARADQALYAAKRDGRDQWQLAAPAGSGFEPPH